MFQIKEWGAIYSNTIWAPRWKLHPGFVCLFFVLEDTSVITGKNIVLRLDNMIVSMSFVDFDKSAEFLREYLSHEIGIDIFFELNFKI